MLYGKKYDKLRDVLRLTRQQADLTQTQLADKLGKGQSYVSKVERGEQYMDVIEFIEWCEACNTTPDLVIMQI